MSTIAINPNIIPRPNHHDPAYAYIRNLIVASGLSNKQAVESLDRAWDRQHKDQVAAWNAQLEADAKSNIFVPKDHLQALLYKRLVGEAQQKSQTRGIEIDFNKMIDDYIPPRPSEYALNKLKRHEYIELWYFSPEGIQEAEESPLSYNDDAYRLCEVDGIFVLKSIAQPSPSAIRDTDLTWCQMSTAKYIYFYYLRQTGWPERYICALAGLFTLIDTHPMRCQRANGPEILMIYQARVRERWHNALRNNFEVFDPSILNENILNAISNEVQNRENERELAELKVQLERVEALERETTRGRHNRKNRNWRRRCRASPSLSPKRPQYLRSRSPYRR